MPLPEGAVAAAAHEIQRDLSIFEELNQNINTLRVTLLTMQEQQVEMRAQQDRQQRQLAALTQQGMTQPPITNESLHQAEGGVQVGEAETEQPEDVTPSVGSHSAAPASSNLGAQEHLPPPDAVTPEAQFPSSTSQHTQVTQEPPMAITHPRSANPGPITTTVTPIIMSRDNVPTFRADVPASQPLRRNQEIESWIKAIENAAQPQSDKALLALARSHVKGVADLIVNGRHFERINDWEIFKYHLRAKFRGTCSSGDFFKLLSTYRMKPSQAPLDFYLELEGAVSQGARDYPESIGDPDDLVRRHFLDGLPEWLQDLLVIKEDCPPDLLAEAGQRAWNRRYGLRTERGPHTSEDIMPQRPNYTPQPQARNSAWPSLQGPQQGYDVYAVQGGNSHPSQHQPPKRRWCDYHRMSSHDTSECRAQGGQQSQRPLNIRCFWCQEWGHYMYNCPFRQSQQAPRGQTPAGRSSGPINASSDAATDTRDLCP